MPEEEVIRYSLDLSEAGHCELSGVFFNPGAVPPKYYRASASRLLLGQTHCQSQLCPGWASPLTWWKVRYSCATGHLKGIPELTRRENVPLKPIFFSSQK